MNNDTQPLVDAPEAEELSVREQIHMEKTWHELTNHPFVQALRREYGEAPEHIHGPFTFLLNQNHNALRGCTSCGQTWVGVMAGTEDTIRWHSVHESEEEEE
jgi:hypothetical protein